MNAAEKLFSQNPIFAALSSAKRETLLREAIVRDYNKGQMITCRGDAWSYLFFVASGGVRALKESSEGRSLVVTIFKPGDIFWGLAFFYEDMPMPVSLEAGQSTRLYLWPRERMLPTLIENGEVSWELARLMILKMARASEILEEMTFQPVAGRLAKLLIDTADDENRERITRSMTLDEMAARIGTTREMVCRFLHRFADEGMIDITRTEYRIADRGRLSDTAKNTRG